MIDNTQRATISGAIDSTFPLVAEAKKQEKNKRIFSAVDITKPLSVNEPVKQVITGDSLLSLSLDPAKSTAIQAKQQQNNNNLLSFPDPTKPLIVTAGNNNEITNQKSVRQVKYLNLNAGC